MVSIAGEFFDLTRPDGVPPQKPGRAAEPQAQASGAASGEKVPYRSLARHLASRSRMQKFNPAPFATVQSYGGEGQPGQFDDALESGAVPPTIPTPSADAASAEAESDLPDASQVLKPLPVYASSTTGERAWPDRPASPPPAARQAPRERVGVGMTARGPRAERDGAGGRPFLDRGEQGPRRGSFGFGPGRGRGRGGPRQQTSERADGQQLAGAPSGPRRLFSPGGRGGGFRGRGRGADRGASRGRGASMRGGRGRGRAPAWESRPRLESEVEDEDEIDPEWQFWADLEAETDKFLAEKLAREGPEKPTRIFDPMGRVVVLSGTLKSKTEEGKKDVVQVAVPIDGRDPRQTALGDYRAYTALFRTPPPITAPVTPPESLHAAMEQARLPRVELGALHLAKNVSIPLEDKKKGKRELAEILGGKVRMRLVRVDPSRPGYRQSQFASPGMGHDP